MQEHDTWIWKAENDLLGAQQLVVLERTLDLAVYHAHQCAEKALKAYLVFKKTELKKTHNLVLLLECCYDFDGEFWTLFKEATFLNPFSVCFRYPGDLLLPDVVIVKKALEAAEQILNFVKERIVFLDK